MERPGTAGTRRKSYEGQQIYEEWLSCLSVCCIINLRWLCLNHHLCWYLHFALILLVKSALVREPSWRRRSYWAAGRAELIVMIAAATITLSCVVGDLSQSPSFITVHHYIVGSSDLDLLHRSGRWTPGLSVIDIYVREWGTHGQRWVILKAVFFKVDSGRKTNAVEVY